LKGIDVPKRPRSHELETLSCNQLRNIFTDIGWTVEDLRHDYGEDLLIRIFKNERTTPYSFFIQAKATDNIDRYIRTDKKCLHFPIDTEHIEHWKEFWEPVILTLYDAQSDITYWEPIQHFLDKQQIKSFSKKKMQVEIPLGNKLDESGLKRIARYTMQRFRRYEKEHQGTEMLVEFIEKKLNVKTFYDPQFQFLFSIKRPQDGHIEFEEGTIGIEFFKHFQQQERETGISMDDSVNEYFSQAILQVLKKWDAIESDQEKGTS
jgi:Domain of unknown function (DUF4365)